MRRDIAQLEAGHFDILVIGGGINGCAIARDAALRGAKVALIEKDDFAAGASGKTTKLIHGGIRYLEQFNFKLVYEALHERAILLKTSPHLVKPLEFIIPAYKGDPRSLLKIRTGVFIYDKLAGSNNIRCHQTLKKNAALSVEQNIEPSGLKGAVVYYDAQMDDIRLCLDNALSAYKAGGYVANKIEAAGFIKKEGKITGVEALDKLTQKKFLIYAGIVVNATGAWSNRIVKIDEPGAPEITRPTKGIHIVYRSLPHKRAILLSGRKEKRIFFIIPWRDLALIGTTDTDYSGSLDEVYANADEVDYLLEETRRVFPNENLGRKGVITTFAGLRPLVNRQNKPAWQVSREHLIKESASGLISVVGGKYTTYRHLAQQVVDLALLKMKGRVFKKCVTKTLGLSSPTSDVYTSEVYTSDVGKADLTKLIEYAVKEEMANSLADLLVRRLQLSTTPSLGLSHLQECADIMSRLLNWSDTQKGEQISMYKEEVKKNMDF